MTAQPRGKTCQGALAGGEFLRDGRRRTGMKTRADAGKGAKLAGEGTAARRLYGERQYLLAGGEVEARVGQALRVKRRGDVSVL